jgi:hypothetical protein
VEPRTERSNLPDCQEQDDKTDRVDQAGSDDGHSTYTPPRAWHKEVRCLVDQQESGVVSCIERISEYPFIERRLLLTGLKHATVHFYPENDRKVIMAANDNRSYNLDSMPYGSEEGGKRLVVKEVTGQLLISW